MSPKSMKMRITTVAALFTFCMMMMASTGAFAAQKTTSTTSAPTQLTGFVQGNDGAGDSFNGLLTVQSFANQSGQLMASGVLNGTMTYANGTTAPVSNQAVTAPVSSIGAGCPILNLVLGPLNLNILGLNISLNQVILSITAIPGAGNLLGNLLCDIAHLLDGGNVSTLLNQLVTALNQLLAAL